MEVIYEDLGVEIGRLVQAKQSAYGNAFSRCDEFLRLLYPNGVAPEQYTDLLCIVRIFDKLCRIATDNDPTGESPYRDIAGYGLLGVALALESREPAEAPPAGS